MDEAKTMYSIGGYHENIINLQGISYTPDFKTGNLRQVSINYGEAFRNAKGIYSIHLIPNISLYIIFVSMRSFQSFWSIARKGIYYRTYKNIATSSKGLLKLKRKRNIIFGHLGTVQIFTRPLF